MCEKPTILLLELPEFMKTFRIISIKKFLYGTQNTYRLMKKPQVYRKHDMMHKASCYFVSAHIYVHNKSTF